jgi:hypothetical protein
MKDRDHSSHAVRNWGGTFLSYLFLFGGGKGCAGLLVANYITSIFVCVNPSVTLGGDKKLEPHQYNPDPCGAERFEIEDRKTAFF